MPRQGEARRMTDQEARERYRKRVEALESLGDRGSGTLHEKLAADYLLDQLRTLGLSAARLEPFRGCDSHGQRLFVHAFLGVIATLLLWAAPTLALVLGFLALTSLIVESSTKRVLLSRPLMRRPSQNVVAAVPAAGRARRRVVVIGHYDTQRTGWIWADAFQARAGPVLAKLPWLMQSPMFSVLLALALVPFVAILKLLGAGDAAVMVPAVAALVLSGAASVFLGQWGLGPFVPGANDNATGACAVISLAESWLAQPVEEVEAVFLVTGCEETGLLGATAWAKAHASDLASLPTFFVNFDSLGYGHPIFLEGEFSLAGLPYRYPRHVVQEAAAAARELALVDAGPHTLPVPSDGLAFLARSVPGVSIMAWGEIGRMPNYHQLTDTSDRMSFDVAWRCVEFADAVARRLARLGQTSGPSGAISGNLTASPS
jgi:hypothetical protein